MATYQSPYKAVFLASVSFFGFAISQAYASDVCTSIKTDQPTEAHFAQSQAREYITTHNHIHLRYAIGAPELSGSCYSEGLNLLKEGGEREYVTLDCSYNGCRLGDDSSLIEWRGDAYLISKGGDLGIFERLNGWQNFSAKEQAVLKFRNLTEELYLISPEKLDQTHSICEMGYKIADYKEKPITPSATCDSLAANNVSSVFPPADNANSVTDRLGESYNPSQLVTLDLNGDGVVEHFAPATFSSGGGCGCDIGKIMFFDENKQPVKPIEGFLKQISMLKLGCKEWVDIISLNGKYYLEKRTGNKHRRVRTREIYPLSGDNAFQQICGYVNESPVNWEKR